MMDDIADATHESEGLTSIYLACTPEDLILVEMHAWELGGNLAAVDAEPALESISAILDASEVACDEVLEIYVPLDVGRFRDVFTRAWCAGYCCRIARVVPTDESLTPPD
jgi:hypothetical protein